MLEGGRCRRGEKIVLDEAGEPFLGGEIIFGNGDVIILAIDGTDDVDEFVVRNAVEGEELEVEVFAEFHDVVLVVGTTLETVFIDDFDLVIDT